jgi:thiol-disulfide isomerase/thioredoxin
MLKITVIVASALALAATMPCRAGDEPTLGIGDAAPEIDIAHWLKGKEVESFDNGKIYVLEFWATWCGPCKVSMPHISELQEHYRDYDVTFIGVSDEPLEKVQGFIQKDQWDKRTRYTVATDPDKSVYESYMVAAKQNGIPTAFIIGKDSKIEWIGHPMQIDVVIEKVVTDGWDREVYRDKVIPLQMKLGASKDKDQMLSIIDELIEIGMVDTTEYKFQKCVILLKDKNQPDAAYALGREIMKEKWDDPQILNAMAWFTVDEPGIETRDLDFALKAAKRANELTKGEDPAILDTVARIYYEKGDVKKAIELQKQAVDKAEGRMADQLREALEKYQTEAGRI